VDPTSQLAQFGDRLLQVVRGAVEERAQLRVGTVAGPGAARR
jgi:hypothetical protein